MSFFFLARIIFLGEEQLPSRRQVSSCLYLYLPQEVALIMNQKCRQLPGSAPAPKTAPGMPAGGCGCQDT